MRDPNRMNYKLDVFPRATTPNDFYSSYVQTFTNEDRRRELLDARSMAVEIAEEAPPVHHPNEIDQRQTGARH